MVETDLCFLLFIDIWTYWMAIVDCLVKKLLRLLARLDWVWMGFDFHLQLTLMVCAWLLNLVSHWFLHWVLGFCLDVFRTDTDVLRSTFFFYTYSYIFLAWISISFPDNFHFRTSLYFIVPILRLFNHHLFEFLKLRKFLLYQRMERLLRLYYFLQLFFGLYLVFRGQLWTRCVVWILWRI